MKNFGSIIPVFFAIFLFAAGLSMNSSAEEIKNQPQNAKTKIIAYYFAALHAKPLKNDPMKR
ncbi:MAG: hypothetical protein B6245_17790 [Desulfobacteraceae bacterium 4572_88]|nr:MAG: hypothetical protein B6245_17790 [Desulfobacteraceae bacterium 4572_88]